jgi:3-dehydroquinate synthase
LYLDTPSGFATQVVVAETPCAAHLPDSDWILLGDANARPAWLSFGMPEPPVSAWVETSEATKRMETILPWLELWATRGVRRGHTLVAVGGGVLTDMGGLAASLYMRGMAWHSWPTTLLAQVDAGVGGKTAVNLDAGKNMAGAFHHPQQMVVATGFLDTLPSRHKKSGMWELVKMAVLEGDVAWADSLLDREKPSTCDMELAIKAKVEIVNSDFREAGERRLLNLGHTLGHALESASGFDLFHGEAVGLGTLAACLLSEELGLAVFPLGFKEKMAQCLTWLMDLVPSWESCLPFLLRDKKIEAGHSPLFIVPAPGSRPIQQKTSIEAIGSVHAKLLAMLRRGARNGE